ncbi:SDR family oxidoreductase [Aureibacillus halotolerans]|uniref:SDR family oxidoreductase n=1 Tax=Aureibacillus halotolerans TaxID=1508390 RepID=UPI00105DB1F7
MAHVFISAGTKGLGKQVAIYFLKRGHPVTMSYFQDQSAVMKLRKEMPDDEHLMHFVQGDVTKEQDVQRMVQEAKEKHGPVLTLICNAGPYVFERKSLASYSTEEWNTMIHGNLSSVFHFFKACVNGMREAHFGRIITYGFQDAPNAPGWVERSAFAAAKTGLVSLTKTIAMEEASYGITANMVCPGDISGSMKEAFIAESSQALKAAPVGRAGTGEDIARAVGFFASEDSGFVTGTVLEITGGENVVYQKTTK